MTDPAERPAPTGLAGLVGDVLTAFSGLIAGEIALVGAEINVALRRALRAVILLIVAALLVLVALLTLAQAAVDWVAGHGLSQPLAGLLVGVCLALLALGITRFALLRLSLANLVPRRSLESLRRDAETLKTKVNPDGTDHLRP